MIGNISHGDRKVVPPTSTNPGYGDTTESIAGFWSVTMRCTTNRDRLRVDMSPGPTLKTASKLKKDCDRKTLPSARRSTRLRCSKKLSAHRVSEGRSFPNCQSRSDRLHRSDYGGNRHRQRTHRPRRAQTLPKIWSSLRECELCRTSANASHLGIVWP